MSIFVTNDTLPADLPGSNRQFLLALETMHLQWFAAEDEGRSEEPTEHKIRKAREEGRVAKSQDLSDAVVLLATIVALAALSGYLLQTFAEMLRFYLRQACEIDPTNSQILAPSFLTWFIKLALPVCLIGMVAAIASNLVQVGFLFTVKPLKPDFKKVMPKFGQYFKRSFASVEALYNLAKSFGKIAVIIGIAWNDVSGKFNQLMNLPKRTYMEGFGLVAQLCFDIMLQSAIFMLGLALFDYWFQRRQFRDSLKMTVQEIKEERKSYDGDPLVKSRLRSRMREILTSNMMKNIPRADVVVTNPTHFAVALEYQREAMAAPQVIAKGQDLIAQRIKEIARENNIPIIENKPLARALFAEVDVGESIPEKFYEAVVVVLKQVDRMKRKDREAV
jgi:flagellar biosynthetic protein FlhB